MAPTTSKRLAGRGRLFLPADTAPMTAAGGVRSEAAQLESGIPCINLMGETGKLSEKEGGSPPGHLTLSPPNQYSRAAYQDKVAILAGSLQLRCAVADLATARTKV